MKDTEFIELLNLYLDHEISTADAARLEAEVQRNPARYRIYQDYCRMQKGCTLLAADFTADTPTVVAFEPTRRISRPNIYAIGSLMAAAACVTFVILNQTTSVAPMSGPAIAENTNAAPAAATVALDAGTRGTARTVSVPARQQEFHSVLAAHSLQLNDTVAATDASNRVQLDWINKMQLTSLPRISAEEVRFEIESPLKPAPRVFSSGQPAQGAMIESAAWQFQR